MEVILEYPMKEEKWIHEPIEKFMGENKTFETQYGIGISERDPRSPQHCYFNVACQYELNNLVNGRVFYAEVVTTFLIKCDNQEMDLDFLFPMIEKGGKNFADRFREKTQNTNLVHHKIARPVLKDLKYDLEKKIQYWNEHHRNISLN